MNQNRVTKPIKLLNSNGDLTSPGYATELLFEYNRNDIKANHLRIKEWDYYLVYNDTYGVALTIDDNSYMGLVSASILYFKEKRERTVSLMNWFPLGKTNFPPTSKTGNVSLKSTNYDFNFYNDNGKRSLKIYMKDFDKNKDFTCELKLTNEPRDSMVIATPFDKPKFFYYNQKIVGFYVEGYVQIGDEKIEFTEKNKTFGILDWGRGVWTYNNMWYWSCACGLLNGVPFGFNLGYGFGDTTKASENMVFYNGIAHKLDRIYIDLRKKCDGSWDFLNIWKFTSNDNRLTLFFEPVLDRAACTDAIILKSDQHQVFGYFTGFITLDDGVQLEITRFLGFVERVENKW